MKKILSILICVILGVNLTYAATAKAVATAFAQPATAGDVYVSKTNVDINTITGWAGTSTNENTGTSGLSAGKASVYSYAKGKNGYTLSVGQIHKMEILIIQIIQDEPMRKQDLL